MLEKDEKLSRLLKVARMYYLGNQKQSDIAKVVGVSRPFVSRMLQEARDLGLVEIKIHEPEGLDKRIFRILNSKYGIQGGALALDGANDIYTNENLSCKALTLIESLDTKRLGLGWGHFIGELIKHVQKQNNKVSSVFSVCPLIGNAGMLSRNYQSNENVRLMAEKLGAKPYYLDLPALPGDCTEKDLLCSTNGYKFIEHTWRLMDTALVNVGNYPSSPDFASGARYGMLLQQKKACGRLIAYYYNEDGEIISSQEDFAIQIPLDILKNCKNLVGICSANTGIRALKGALASGLLTHIVVRKELIKEIIY